MELPVQFRERMLKLLGEEEFKQYEESFKAVRTYGLRVNTSKISVEEFEKITPFEIKKIPWIPNGFFYDGTKDSPAKHPYYHAGLYYLQEPSAMTPASLLPVEPGDYVLDLCAAPGGKATELGVRLQGEGLLAANDISNSRAKGLLKNLELFGISNLLVVNETPEKLLTYFEEYFDKILIDAPCSGEGMFRKDPAIMKSWEKKGPEEFANIQRGIVSTAINMLKPGGMLLYSTCTFAPEENEGTILHLLKTHQDLRVVKPPMYEGFSGGRPEWLGKEYCQYPQLFDGEFSGYEEQLKNCIRIWPHKMNGEGHFIALLQKGDPEESYKNRKNKAKKPIDNEDFQSFMSLLCVDWEKDCFDMVQDRVYYVPYGPHKTNRLHLLRNGLLLGECRKNRFEPSQALAMALKKEQFKNLLLLDKEDVRTIKYLKGETIDVSQLLPAKASGWHLVCVDGFPLGWGKVTNGTLKNKYHAGWRWM